MGTLKINEVYAFIADNKTGESIIGATLPSGKQTAFVTEDKNVVELLKPYAKDAAEKNKVRIKLVKFIHREEVEEF